MPWFRGTTPLVGQIDHVSHRKVRGWAWFAQFPKKRVCLEVFYKDVFLGQVVAGMFRSDLQTHGIGDGHHAFTFHLPSDISDNGFKENYISIASAGPERWRLPASAEATTPGWKPLRLTADHQKVLGPFLETLNREDAPATRIAIGRRTRIEQLCADAAGREVSAFAEHIAYKYKCGHLITEDISAFWSWYLGTYASEHGPRLAPLSGPDVERLTRSAQGNRSFASSLFLGPDSGDVTFEWANEAERIFVADCLVTRRDVDALRAVHPSHQAFPLSAFMRIAKSETAILRALPTVTERQRRRVYALFMVIGLRNPSFLSYLPSAWLIRLLESRVGLEAALAELFGAHRAMGRDRYAAEIEATGYDIASQSFSRHFYDGHRVFGGPVILTSPEPVDVQVFGPFRRKMGLGESCRRVAAALRTTSLSCNFVDYGVGYSDSDLDQAEPLNATRPARLNILHLNAEEIPEAIAYLPDVFSQTFTVAMPYWEMNSLARPHLLGVKLVDEIWAPSQFLVDVFSRDCKVARWVGMSCSSAPVPTQSQRAALRHRLGFALNTFVFLTTSDALSWVQRKNPLAAIEAFRSAFATHNVSLLVKTHNLRGPLSDTQIGIWDKVRRLCAADSRIKLIEESFDATDQRTLLAACDCLVSLHRAEGLGLDVIDALDLGTPVIVTDYSGTRELCSSETAWLVDFDLRAVDANDYSFVEPGHVWAEPRADSAIRAMRDVFDNPRQRLARIDRGKEVVSAAATSQRFGRRLADVIRLRLGSV